MRLAGARFRRFVPGGNLKHTGSSHRRQLNS